MILCSAVKMWITLKIPKMEDGNDFGVAIQEECVDTISEIEESAYSILDMISTYHSTRGNYVVQVGQVELCFGRGLMGSLLPTLL